MLKIEVFRHNEPQLEGLATKIQASLETANKQLARVVEPDRHKVVRAQLNNHKAGENRPIELTFSGDYAELAFCLNDVSSLYDSNELGYETARNLAEVCLTLDPDHFLDHFDANVLQEFKLPIKAAYNLATRIHDDLPVELLCIKAGYADQSIAALGRAVDKVAPTELNNELRANRIVAPEAQKKSAYLLIQSYIPVFLAVYTRHLRDENSDSLYQKLIAMEERFYNSISKIAQPEFLTYLRSEAPTFADGSYKSAEVVDDFVVRTDKKLG